MHSKLRMPIKNSPDRSVTFFLFLVHSTLNGVVTVFFYIWVLKLPLFWPQATRPALHTLAGYPPLPACLPGLLGTRENPRRKIYDEMNFGKTPMHTKAYVLL